MMATARRSSPRCAAATAIPSAALIEVLEWPTPKVSYSLSLAGGKRREALVLLDGVQPLAPAGQHLVRVGLVPHVPDQPVVRGIEHVMQRNREFDGAQSRGKMPASGADAVDQELAQLLRQRRSVWPPAGAADQPVFQWTRAGDSWSDGALIYGSLYCSDARHV